MIGDICAFPWREHAERELAKAHESGVSIITSDDPAYPDNLKDAPDPPLCLYVKGGLLSRDTAAIAIVGTRRPTHYGEKITYDMARDLASAGITIVSGLARGIDTQAHKGALSVGGRTIAVLGCGIDVAYPPENRGLMEEIAHSGRGAVITENPFGTKPESGYFPARNRIISGLSRGTAIIEAAEDSGSLITADYAIKQGRRLFAVPGSVVSPNSRGPNSLIKAGALLVEGAGDVLQALKMQPLKAPAEAEAQPALTRDECAVFKSITDEPKHIDVVTSESGLAPGKAGGTLMNLELKGLIKQMPGKYFVRNDGFRK